MATLTRDSVFSIWNFRVQKNAGNLSFEVDMASLDWKLDTDLTCFKNFYLRWIIDLNITCKTIKILEYNIEDLNDLGFDNDLLNSASKE